MKADVPEFNPNSVDAVVSRIDTRVAQLDDKLERLLTLHEQSHRDHSERLRKLEEERWYQRGAVAVFSVAAVAVWNWLTSRP